MHGQREIGMQQGSTTNIETSSDKTTKTAAVLTHPKMKA